MFSASTHFVRRSLDSIFWQALFALLVLATMCKAEEASEPRYPFPVEPPAILARPAVKELGPAPQLSAEERRLLEKAYTLRDDVAARDTADYDRLVLDLLFTGSGASTAEELADLRRQFDRVVTSARAAVEGRKPDAHAGEVLMQFLHADLLKGGYVADQSSLVETFRAHTYNCVSSSAAYYAVGRALGMKFRVICIPGNNWVDGHVCLDLIDGDRTYQLEPTNPDGFDWETKINRPGVTVAGFGLSPDRKEGYATDGLALAACIYRNRSVAVTKGNAKGDAAGDRDYAAAASLVVRALMCAPYDPSSIHSLQAVYVNWGPAASEAGRYEEAIAALEQGLALTNHRDVRNNMAVVGLRWMRHLTTTKQDAAAEAAARRVAKLLPDDADFQGAGLWKHVADEAFEADDGGPVALDLVRRALQVADPTTHVELREYRIALLRRWSQWHLRKGDVDGSLAVLRRGLEFDAASPELAEGVGYHVYEALSLVDPAGAKPQEAVAHFEKVAQTFPGLAAVSEHGFGHARRSIRDLCEAGKFAEALAKVEQYAPVVADAAQRRSIAAEAWDAWGSHLRDEKNWTAAVAKYVEGLQALPADDELLRGATITVDRWAEILIDAQKWDDAIAAYDHGLKYFPENGHLTHNREYCLAKKAEAAAAK
ncbi:MAG: hypothetical protein C0483_10630 [Pirellula sp.]|nr:hypothetical protein [Pirellula sp.]